MYPYIVCRPMNTRGVWFSIHGAPRVVIIIIQEGALFPGDLL